MDIHLSNVSKAFNKKSVISNLDMTIKSGQTICLLGPSGAGKTTTIRMIIGAIAADTGQIHLGQTPMPNRKILSRIGFMPQNDALYEDLNAESNLWFFSRLAGANKKTIPQRITEVLTLVGLEDDRHKKVINYSGGMKKRLSLAIALLHKPDVLLLDEPTVGVDPVLRRSIWNELHKLGSSGTTILMTTHVMDEVSECDGAALIYNGKLIFFDSVQQLIKKTNGKIENIFFEAAKKGAQS